MLIVELFLPHAHGIQILCQVALDGVWPMSKSISFKLYESMFVSIIKYVCDSLPRML